MSNLPNMSEALLKNSMWGFEIVEAKKEDAKPVVESKGEQKVEKHVCPLCESELKEALSDEALLEHAAEMANVFESAEKEYSKLLAESDEDDEDLEDEDDEDSDEGDEDEEDSDEDEAN